jgi:hypothetical protein
MPERLQILILALGLMAAVLPIPGRAGFISIQSELTPSFDGKTLVLDAKVINRGDEAAYDVSLVAEVIGTAIQGPNKNTLGPNESFAFRLAQELALPRKGEYRLVATVKYTDTNHYPFLALAIAPFIFGENRPNKIEASLNSLQITDEGTLELKLKNPEQKAKAISARLVLPGELSVSAASKDMQLAPGSDSGVAFHIKNVSAPPGSSYPVYALLDWDDDGFHFSHAASGNLAVVQDRGFVRSHRSALMGLAVVLAAWFLYSNIAVFLPRSR